MGRFIELRWNIDAETGVPHFFEEHGVTVAEVEDVLDRPSEDRAGSEDSRVAIGSTMAGRVLRVIYVPDPDKRSAFVVTAYPLAGKPLHAFHRRMRKRGRR